MIKKCSGCGIKLQDINKDALGYTPDINNKLCMRCFKLTHYNELISSGVKIDNNKLISDINKKNCFVVFLVDFLNIYAEIIETYKSIKNEKILVITKSDLIPKNIIKDKLINNIKDIYKIKEDVLLVSSNNHENLNTLINKLNNKKNIMFSGYTNAGKSSLINELIASDITVSKRANTTQDFMKLKFDGYIIYDTPGFMSKYFLDNKVPKMEVKPITYQLTNKYYLTSKEFNLYISDDTNITMYLKVDNIEKRKLKENISYNILVPKGHDLIIKGLGFIKFSKSTKISLNIDESLIEVRPSIVGDIHE